MHFKRILLGASPKGIFQEGSLPALCAFLESPNGGSLSMAFFQTQMWKQLETVGMKMAV